MNVITKYKRTQKSYLILVMLSAATQQTCRQNTGDGATKGSKAVENIERVQEVFQRILNRGAVFHILKGDMPVIIW